MANDSDQKPSSDKKLVWYAVAIVIVLIGSAVAYRVYAGAQFEAEGKEWKIKLTEAANQLEAGTKLLKEENERLKEEAQANDARWSQAVDNLQKSCPKAKPPAPPVLVPSAKDSTDFEKRLKDLQARSENVRQIAEGITTDVPIWRVEPAMKRKAPEQ